jgi:uncharacterized protein
VDIDVVDVPEANRYEARVDGVLAAFAAYQLRGDTIVFTHTQTEPDFEGHGVGSRLARGALDDVRARGLDVVPLCPFINAFIAKHEEYQDLVSAHHPT